MKQTVTTVFLLLGFLSFSQDWDFEKPNYKEIEKNIQKEGSNLFYNSLMDRYLKADSTFTLEEKRHLYYGYAFNEKYAPYSHSEYSDSLSTILQKEKLDTIDLKKVVHFTNALLHENPFDLNAINYQLYALDQMEKKEAFDKKIIQFQIVMDALISSGNGTSKKEAFYVIETSHEYALLNILGFQFGGTQSLIEHYDYLTVAENQAGIDGLYFDVSLCLNSMSEMLKD
ncbi:MAG TPA: DUF4919 domain-containing protein [Flavobacteriaceae bacterium]|nr:DUF4919 domain-containing protein [Flavobacteriaceae bacterium]